jgi:hypothetical protein
MISRQDALTLVRKYIKTENTVKHLLATEAIMRTLAQKFEPDQEDVWGIAGLIHDLDWETIKDKEKEHAKKTVEILKQENVDVPQEVIQTILAHCCNLYPEYQPQNKRDWSLFIADSLTGLIIATALVRPDKKLESVELKSVMKKFKQPAFAAGTRREDIALCEEKLGLKLDEFINIGLMSLQKISQELGL